MGSAWSYEGSVLDSRTIHQATYPQGMRRRTTAAIMLIIVVVAGAVAYTLYTTPTTHLPIVTFSEQPTSTSSSCSGYPPGGNCLATYSYTFTISVNYGGLWMLTYQGYNSLGKSNPVNINGSYSGSGFYSKNVTLSGMNNSGLTLCASAQKLDGSNSTLNLWVTGHNETSLPYGSASFCGGVAP
jgi:hypothetical protein